MKNKIFAFLFCVLFIIPVSAQNKEQNSQKIPAAKIEKIDLAVKDWMALHKAPALSLAIVTDNALSFSKGYGVADLENNTPASGKTVYRLASIAKTITAVAVMQLVERGKLDLDAPVNKYCAAYPEKQSLKDAPDKQFVITSRMLLVHQSGVRHNSIDEVFSTKYFSSINDAVGTFKADPLVVEPLTKYSYSTPGYTLLGCAIEGASGMSYFDYLRENILKPAGMTNTYIDNTYAIIPNRARGYRKTQAGEIQNAPLHDTSIKIPGGGLATTVEDLAKFGIALNTDQLVKPETLTQMWTKPKTSDGKEQGYAMGILINNGDNLLRVFNDGSQAGTRSYFFMVPKQKFVIALMTNLERAWCEELVPKIIEALTSK